MTMDQNWAQPNVPAQPVKKPGIVGLVIAIVLIVAGPVLIVIGSLNFTSGVGSAEVYYSNDFPAQVVLKAGDETGIWTENGATGYCQVLDPMMLTVPISTSGFGSQTVNEYNLSATFIPPSDGTYTVICTTTLIPFNYKVAPTMHVAGFVIALIAGIILLIAGIILLIVTFLRRTLRTRNNQATLPYPPQTWQYSPSQPDYGTLPEPPQYPPAPQPQFPPSPPAPPAPPAVPSAQPPQYGPQPPAPTAPQPSYGLPPQPVYGAPFPPTPNPQSAPKPPSPESPSNSAPSPATPPDMPSFLPPAPSAP